MVFCKSFGNRSLFAKAAVVSMVALGVLSLCAGDNLLSNPGFENGFDSWRKPARMWSVDDGAGYGGTKGLVWSCSDTNHYEYPAQYIKIEPGFAYRMTALVKVESISSKAPQVGFEWFSANGTWMGGDYAVQVDDNGILKDGWVRYEACTRVMPPEVARGGFICFLPRGYTGHVRFDDVTLESVPVKTIEFFLSSAYRDMVDSGKVRFTASIHVNLEKVDAYLSYTDATGKSASVMPTLFTAERVLFELDASKLAKGTHPVSLVIRDKSTGKTVATQSLAFTRLDVLPRRRVTFDAKKRMLLDGKPFFPIGHYIAGAIKGEALSDYKRGPHNFLVQYGRITPGPTHLDFLLTIR